MSRIDKIPSHIQPTYPEDQTKNLSEPQDSLPDHKKIKDWHSLANLISRAANSHSKRFTTDPKDPTAQKAAKFASKKLGN